MDRIVRVEVFLGDKRISNYKIKDGEIKYSNIETEILKNGTIIKTYYEAA
jgi:hypothetical protein